MRIFAVAAACVAAVAAGGCGRTELDAAPRAPLDGGVALADAAGAPDAELACVDPALAGTPWGGPGCAGSVVASGNTPYGAFSATRFDLIVGFFNCPESVTVAVWGGAQLLTFAVPYDGARRSLVGTHALPATLLFSVSRTQTLATTVSAIVTVTASDDPYIADRTGWMPGNVHIDFDVKTLCGDVTGSLDGTYCHGDDCELI